MCVCVCLCSTTTTLILSLIHSVHDIHIHFYRNRLFDNQSHAYPLRGGEWVLFHSAVYAAQLYYCPHPLHTRRFLEEQAREDRLLRVGREKREAIGEGKQVVDIEVGGAEVGGIRVSTLEEEVGEDSRDKGRENAPSVSASSNEQALPLRQSWYAWKKFANSVRFFGFVSLTRLFDIYIPFLHSFSPSFN